MTQNFKVLYCNLLIYQESKAIVLLVPCKQKENSAACHLTKQNDGIHKIHKQLTFFKIKPFSYI